MIGQEERGKKKEPIKNLEVIKNIYRIMKESGKNINFIKVKGHSENFYNNLVDEMAVAAKRSVE